MGCDCKQATRAKTTERPCRQGLGEPSRRKDSEGRIRKRLNSYCDEEFWKLFAGLPSHVQKQANNAYAHFKRDIWHPSLHFKCINKKKQLYSVRIGKDYRAVGRKNNDTIV